MAAGEGDEILPGFAGNSLEVRKNECPRWVSAVRIFASMIPRHWGRDPFSARGILWPEAVHPSLFLVQARKDALIG